MTASEPTLLFFRHRPQGWTENASVASSLQSTETSFFLIALGRYPHALSVCCSAIEGALQAAVIGASQKDGLQTLIERARGASASISAFPIAWLERLRETRNRFTHHGFSPRDDSVSVDLYVRVALPFLSLCYREFHSFDLLDGLLIEYARHLKVAQRVNALMQVTAEPDLSYCIHGFSHLIRSSFKDNFSAHWEIDALVRAEEIGAKYKHTLAARQQLEALFDEPRFFNCPICGDLDSIVAQLDLSAIGGKEIRVRQMACVGCGFVVSESQHYLADALLEEQLSAARPRILAEYGIR